MSKKQTIQSHRIMTRQKSIHMDNFAYFNWFFSSVGHIGVALANYKFWVVVRDLAPKYGITLQDLKKRYRSANIQSISFANIDVLANNKVNSKRYICIELNDFIDYNNGKNSLDLTFCQKVTDNAEVLREEIREQFKNQNLLDVEIHSVDIPYTDFRAVQENRKLFIVGKDKVNNPYKVYDLVQLYQTDEDGFYGNYYMYAQVTHITPLEPGETVGLSIKVIQK